MANNVCQTRFVQTPHERDISSRGITSQQASQATALTIHDYHTWIPCAQVGGPQHTILYHDTQVGGPHDIETAFAARSTLLQAVRCSKRYIAPRGTLTPRCTRWTLLQVFTSGRPTQHRDVHSLIQQSNLRARKITHDKSQSQATNIPRTAPHTCHTQPASNTHIITI